MLIDWLLVGLLAGAPLPETPVAPPACDMVLAFAHPDEGGAKTTAVYGDAKALLFGDHININTDGTRRSYKVSDFWGETDALNNLCNAMSDACAGLNAEQLKARRILTQEARSEGWPADKLAQTKISPAILPFRDGGPCPEVDGFMVSATALHKVPVTDACDLDSYIDSLVVPAIVVPKGTNGFSARAVKVGDLAVVMSADGTKIVYAVIGDTGPAKQLGEGTLALAADLLGRTTAPVNYRQVRGKAPYQGQGWTIKRAYVLIFPATRDPAKPYLTREAIEARAAPLFADWGGPDRLKACSAAYQQ